MPNPLLNTNCIWCGAPLKDKAMCRSCGASQYNQEGCCSGQPEGDDFCEIPKLPNYISNIPCE